MVQKDPWSADSDIHISGDCMSKNSPLRITLCQFRVSLELAIEATFQLKDLEISLFRLWLTRSRVMCARSKSAYSHLLLCWAFRSDNETWADGVTTAVKKSWGLFLFLLVVFFWWLVLLVPLLYCSCLHLHTFIYVMYIYIYIYDMWVCCTDMRI